MTTVYVRDATLRRVAEVDDYSSCKVTVASCDVGSWELVMPAAHPAARLLTYRGGIVVERAGRTITSGQPRTIKVEAKRLEPGGRVQEVLTATGWDDNAVLSARLALPGPLGVAQDYDDHSGPAETVLRGFADRNAGPGALPDRRTPRLVLAPDEGRGLGIRGRPDRYDNLLAFMRETARGAGVGFRVLQEAEQLVLRFYVPRDRSRQVVFGMDRQNLLSYSYSTTSPTSNYVYAAGTGELAARLIVERSIPQSITEYGRWEGFADQNNVDDPALLAQKADEQLIGESENSTLSLTPVDGPDTTYGVDYELDDLVTCRVGSPGPTGVPVVVDSVGQLTLELAAGGTRETLTPVMASNGANLSASQLVQTLRQLGRRLSRQEGRT